MKRNYGIEFEFFVLDERDKLVPAYKATRNLDGNPVLGEIKTGVHDNIYSTVFELMKLIRLEQDALTKKGFKMHIVSSVKVADDFIKDLRKDRDYTDRKESTPLEDLSIYPNGKTGKVLPKGVYKASLQINVSANKAFTITEYEKVTVEDKSKYVTKSVSKSHSCIFDYVSLIYKLDTAFEKDLRESDRVKGVYTIKDGILGERIEYRSLPNTVNLETIINLLK